MDSTTTDAATAGGTGGGMAKDPLPAGRVVRLHFRCKAPLAVGSCLRVTGSTLWAPNSLYSAANTSSDLTNPHHFAAISAAVDSHPSSDVPSNGSANAVGGGELIPGAAVSPEEGTSNMNPNTMQNNLYTSSVPLYTTPETYPIWKTRRPVVVVLHKSTASAIQHHYYRYLVVTPAAAADTGTSNDDDLLLDNNNEQQQQQQGGGGEDRMVLDDDESDSGGSSAASSTIGDGQTTPSLTPQTSVAALVEHQQVVATSNDDPTEQPSAVMMWEDPFGATDVVNEEGAGNNNNSKKKNLANLPYRTIDIDVSRAMPQDEHRTLDEWNNPNDVSYQPYQIREAINRENAKVKVQRTTTDTDKGYHLGDSSAQQQQQQGGNNNNDGTTTPPVFSNQQRIFFVCFHLPVVVVQNTTTGEWKASWSESILAKTEGSQIVNAMTAHWIGTVSTRPPIRTKDDQDKVRAVLAAMNCTPIFLPTELLSQHYYGFCKQVLWPAFHNIDILDLTIDRWDQSKLEGWWQSFMGVNQEFARAMASSIQPNDIIWVHDYHLSLLPKFLFEQEVAQYGRNVSRKVFFLHIPFPTSQIFRELECGEYLLEGMLHAHVIGFHAFDHARHFLNAAKRILGLNYTTLEGGLIGVSFMGRTVIVTMSNVSIEPDMVDAALLLPSVQQGTDALRQKHFGRMIIGGCDIGQRLQGVSLKLLAFEGLLKDYPSWQTRVVMVQRIILPGSRQEDEAQTVRELRFLAKRIQDTYGEAVLDYEEVNGYSMPMDRRLALWKASDVLMATPIREGLNHWPMEYIYAHKHPEKPGVVIASEFSAVNSILNGALRLNPYDIQMTITTIDKALTMDMQEREGRRYRDMDFVSGSPSDRWTRNVLRDLKDAILHEKAHSDSTHTSSASTPSLSSQQLGKNRLIDSTEAYLARESGMAFNHLNHQTVKGAYEACTRRVFILDFNGTIVIKEPPGKYLKREILGTSGNKPLPEVIDALTRLCADPKNTVYVVSGDSAENVLNAIGDIPGLGLAVSNGAHFSPPPVQKDQRLHARKWDIFDLGVDWDAVKRVALPVLSKYTARSNGSFVKLTQFSIGWSYYSCDPEWGSMQASHLVLELESELRAFDVRFVTLKGVVEIVPRKLNKGLFVKKVLRDAATQHHEGIDFILCMGDDISDEKMFTSVFSYVAEIGDEENAKPTPPVVGQEVSDQPTMSSSEVRDPMYCYTVAVGKKASHASHWVHDAVEVGNLLVSLSGLEQEETQMRDAPGATEIFG